MAPKPIAAPGLRCKAKAAPRPAPAGDATDAEPDPESESAEAVPVKAPPPLSPYEAAGLIADIIVCAKRLGPFARSEPDVDPEGGANSEPAPSFACGDPEAEEPARKRRRKEEEATAEVVEIHSPETVASSSEDEGSSWEGGY